MSQLARMLISFLLGALVACLFSGAVSIPLAWPEEAEAAVYHCPSGVEFQIEFNYRNGVEPMWSYRLLPEGKTVATLTRNDALLLYNGRERLTRSELQARYPTPCHFLDEAASRRGKPGS